MGLTAGGRRPGLARAAPVWVAARFAAAGSGVFAERCKRVPRGDSVCGRLLSGEPGAAPQLRVGQPDVGIALRVNVLAGPSGPGARSRGVLPRCCRVKRVLPRCFRVRRVRRREHVAGLAVRARDVDDGVRDDQHLTAVTRHGLKLHDRARRWRAKGARRPSRTRT
jgi:hypothetical protein